MSGEGEQWGSMGLNHVWGETREGTGGLGGFGGCEKEIQRKRN